MCEQAQRGSEVRTLKGKVRVHANRQRDHVEINESGTGPAQHSGLQRLSCCGDLGTNAGEIGVSN